MTEKSTWTVKTSKETSKPDEINKDLLEEGTLKLSMEKEWSKSKELPFDDSQEK